MRRRLTALLAALALTLIAAAPAAADPSFGPGGSDGNGNNDPTEQGAGCHPPGQTDELPQCR